MSLTRPPAGPPVGRPGIAATGRGLSFEIFPPKREDAAPGLRDTLARLAAVAPDFVSVTCGAGGSDWRGTEPWVRSVQRDAGLSAAAHLTCRAGTRAEVDAIAARYWEAGVRRIVALRGDAPRDGGPAAPGECYAYACDLVAGLTRVAPFEISVACYPEGHPEASSPDADLDHLQRKVDAGATRMITQYCFDTEAILRFRDRVRARGIRAEFVTGVLPIHSFSQARRFSAACGAGVPAWLERLFDDVAEGSTTHAMLAVNVALDQVRRLAAEGLPAVHVYTLNRAELSLALVRLLDHVPAELPAAA